MQALTLQEYSRWPKVADLKYVCVLKCQQFYEPFCRSSDHIVANMLTQYTKTVRFLSLRSFKLEFLLRLQSYLVKVAFVFAVMVFTKIWVNNMPIHKVWSHGNQFSWNSCIALWIIMWLELRNTVAIQKTMIVFHGNHCATTSADILYMELGPDTRGTLDPSYREVQDLTPWITHHEMGFCHRVVKRFSHLVKTYTRFDTKLSKLVQ